MSTSDHRREAASKGEIREHPASAPTLRPALPGDLTVVARLHATAYAKEYGFGDDFEAYVLRGMVEHLERGSTGSGVWVVEDGGHLVGSIGMVRQSASEVQLRWFLLLREYRGRGLGKTLLDHALRFAREAGYGKVVLWTVAELDAARALYARAGFRPGERVAHHIWGRDLVEERWDLELSGAPTSSPAAGAISSSCGGGEAPSPLTHLQRRAIQAPVALALLRAFEKRLGAEEAREVAAAGIAEDARASGAAQRDRRKGSPLEVLARVVREEWAAEGALDLAFFEETPTRLRFDVVHCAYAELYKDLGAREEGFCLSCSRDGAFARGLDPRLRLERRSTIMEGAPRCDFLFLLEDPLSGKPERGVTEQG